MSGQTRDEVFALYEPIAERVGKRFWDGWGTSVSRMLDADDLIQSARAELLLLSARIASGDLYLNGDGERYISKCLTNHLLKMVSPEARLEKATNSVIEETLVGDSGTDPALRMMLDEMIETLSVIDQVFCEDVLSGMARSDIDQHIGWTTEEKRRHLCQLSAKFGGFKDG